MEYEVLGHNITWYWFMSCEKCTELPWETECKVYTVLCIVFEAFYKSKHIRTHSKGYLFKERKEPSHAIDKRCIRHFIAFCCLLIKSLISLQCEQANHSFDICPSDMKTCFICIQMGVKILEGHQF